MNNLLRTLTESQVNPGSDLKLLLAAVKETRRQCYDSKLSDGFYESLDNLLADLRTITIDNRDAEAFLKPVSRAEVPDYYDYITQPMDLATMAKKVKNKQYKSKREFKDDLDLIWSNCYKYNAAEDHPLRQCADRLKAKAERLLKYITDRKDRTDPVIPFEVTPQPGVARPKLNGLVNGNSYSRSSSRMHTRTPSLTLPNGRQQQQQLQQLPSPLSRKQPALPFAETPAIIRTGEGMVSFRELDRSLAQDDIDPHTIQQLKALVPLAPYHLPNIRFDSPAMDVDTTDEDDKDDAATGDKRKLNGVVPRPRKRARFASSTTEDLSGMWWYAVQSDSMVGNGLPEIPYASSSSSPAPKKPKRRKQKPPTPAVDTSKTLLNLMNNNIKTMRRVRQTHLKLSTVVTSIAGPEDPEGEAAGFGAGPSTSIATPQLPSGPEDELADDKIDERHWIERFKATNGKGQLEIGEQSAHHCISWMGERVLEHAGFQGTSKGALDVLTTVASDYLLNVGRTIRFLSDKYGKTMTPEEIVLHTLFESGVSKIQELERFVSDDIERYGSRLLELEKKLAGVYREVTSGQEALEDEGLFEEEDEEEAGALAIGDFADSLGEDYLGLRELGIADEFGLTNLSIPKSLLRRKKMQKIAAAKPVEKPLDYPLPPPFLPFTFSDAEHQIGLLNPYFQSRFQQLASSQPPLPPPAPSIPSLPGPSIPSLPGPSLLSLPGPSLPPLPGPMLGVQPKPPGQLPYPPIPYPTPTPSAASGSLPSTQPNTQSQTVEPPSASSAPASIPSDLVLPDDSINPLQAKMGPLGQITKPNATSGASKKKVKPQVDDNSGAGAGAGGSGGGGGSGPIVLSTSTGGGPSTTGKAPPATFIASVYDPNMVLEGSNPSSANGSATKKKKGATGVGAGNGRKKKDQAGHVMPLSAVTSQASSNGGGGRGGSAFPSVVIASA